MRGVVHVNRRDFLKNGMLVGGGLMLGCYLPHGKRMSGGIHFPPDACG
ncbi:MAG: hypothetical protein H6Q41_5907 [Deltaproteobacteria bacterium]|nr:hypothetical protein [Deltaproteobacteria bacterium]